VSESNIVATIDYGQIAANARSIIRFTKTPLMAVVKSDAYGHGIVPSAHAAISGGAAWLGTAFLDEAVKLREGGITVPILAWLSPPNEDFRLAFQLGIDLSVSSLEQLKAIVSQAEILGCKPRIHLEVDTGMTRGGALEEFPALVSAIGKLIGEERMELVGTWSHLACSDEPEHPLNQKQSERFETALEYLKAKGISPGIRHIANSGAVIHFPHLYYDMVRSGILIYGYAPMEGFKGCPNVLPVMKLSADVILVKRVPAGTYIGYGASIQLSEDRFIGLIALGYADGIPRRLDGPTPIWCTINGKKAPLIGRVSMDQITVDLGAETTVQAGDRAILFGDDESATADDWAKAAGTISYEILSKIGARARRVSKEI
jgi:alanine racemase